MNFTMCQCLCQSQLFKILIVLTIIRSVIIDRKLVSDEWIRQLKQDSPVWNSRMNIALRCCCESYVQQSWNLYNILGVDE